MATAQPAGGTRIKEEPEGEVTFPVMLEGRVLLSTRGAKFSARPERGARFSARPKGGTMLSAKHEGETKLAAKHEGETMPSVGQEGGVT